MAKYALDTNLYIKAIRSAPAMDELEHFLGTHSPVCYLSSVVLHELLIGATSEPMSRWIEDTFARPFRRSRRLFTPSAGAWEAAGHLVSRLVRKEKIDRRTLPRSFVSDVLLACSCREAGITLITYNERDFVRIRNFTDFSFVAPYPSYPSAP